MKAEIQKILSMNKAGTLSDEQAAELLAGLADDSRAKAPDARTSEGERPGRDGCRCGCGGRR